MSVQSLYYGPPVIYMLCCWLLILLHKHVYSLSCYTDTFTICLEAMSTLTRGYKFREINCKMRWLSIILFSKASCQEIGGANIGLTTVTAR